MVASHGLRALLELTAEGKAAEAARQTLAQLLISTNPALLQRLAESTRAYRELCEVPGAVGCREAGEIRRKM